VIRARACILSLFMLSAGLAACRRGGVGSSAARQNLEDFTLRQSQHGVALWELQARYAVLREDAGEAQLFEPRMQFFRDGAVASRLRSVSGRVLIDTHDVILSTGVVLEALLERSMLFTDSLSYSSKKDLLSTDSEVRVQRPEGRLLGRGLQAKPDLSEIRIFNQRSVVEKGDS